MSTVIKGVDCPKSRVTAGTVIFAEGSQSDCFYIVKTGEVVVYKNYQKPNQIRLASIPEGRVLGEISGIDGLARSATAIAHTDVDLVKVSAAALRWQLKQCPAWFGAIVLDIVERLRHTDELLVKNGIADASSVSSLKDTATQADHDAETKPKSG